MAASVFQFQQDGWLAGVLARHQHDVGKALAGRQFPVERVVVLRIVECKAEHTGQRVFIVVAQDAGVFIMRLVYVVRHGLLITIEHGLKDSLRFVDRRYDVLPIGVLDGVHHLALYLPVGKVKDNQMGGVKKLIIKWSAFDNQMT